MASEISQAFCLLIYSRVIISNSSIISKLICRWKLLEAKNRDNFIKANSLLLAANSTISSLLDQSSY